MSNFGNFFRKCYKCGTKRCVDLNSGSIYSSSYIRRRSGYIGFIALAIGPNKFKKLTRLIEPATQYTGQSLNEKQPITICM